jgi:hypothetical protein
MQPRGRAWRRAGIPVSIVAWWIESAVVATRILVRQLMTELDRRTAILRKFAVAPAWVLLACIAYMTMAPLEVRTTFSYWASLERGAAFFALGILFYLAYGRSMLFVYLIVFGSAALLEIAQFVTVDRHARAVDAIEKIAGGCLGILAGRAVILLQDMRRRTKSAGSQGI